MATPKTKPRWKGWLVWSVKWGLVLLMVWAIRHTLVDAWKQLQTHWDSGEFARQFRPGWLVGALVVYILGLAPAAWFWYRVLRAFEQRPRFYEALRAYYIGHLGKYVPGKAWVVVLRSALVRSPRTTAGVAAAAVFVETLTMMAVGAFLSAVYLVVALGDERELLWAAVVLLLVAGIPTLPPVFKRVAMLVGVLKRDAMFRRQVQRLDFGTLWTGWGAMLLLWFLLGLSLWATLKSVGVTPLGVEQLPRCTATAALATVAGFLVLVLPGGLGVREFVLVALLTPYLQTLPGKEGAAATPELIACVTAALLRLEWLAGELLASGGLYLIRPRRETAAESPAPSGADEGSG